MAGTRYRKVHTIIQFKQKKLHYFLHLYLIKVCYYSTKKETPELPKKKRKVVRFILYIFKLLLHFSCIYFVIFFKLLTVFSLSFFFSPHYLYKEEYEQQKGKKNLTDTRCSVSNVYIYIYIYVLILLCLC